ncbi:MAG: carboxypeptidase regulatory-like domain-containing protein [bacterium]|nr:carboxypeptidase regulatory-like domain-containing protein [bacterium]
MSMVFLALLVALLSFGRGVAGTSGVLDGYVRDLGGHPIAGARVRVMSPGAVLDAVTDERGFFALVNVPPDRYMVVARKHGTTGAYAQGVRVNSDQTTFLRMHVSHWLHCGMLNVNPSIGSDASAEPFDSVDVRLAAQAPPNTPSIPVPMLPPAPAPITFRCL